MIIVNRGDGRFWFLPRRVRRSYQMEVLDAAVVLRVF